MSFPLAPSRALLRALFQANYSICKSCRGIATSPALRSGHNKWSTIKHDKAKNDAKITKQRSVFSHAIAAASKFFGPDPQFNPRLASEIEKAKKGGFPKALIEAAIQRGQGKSASGQALENVVIEAIFPGNIAVVLDFETDSRLRLLQEARAIVKKAGGNVTPTAYLFEKKGEIIFAAKEGIGADEAFEPALEAGALDVEDGPDGKLVVYTSIAETKATAQKLSDDLGLEIESSEIIYDPVEESRVEVDKEVEVEALKTLVERLQEETGLLGIYMNARPGPSVEAEWNELIERIG